MHRKKSALISDSLFRGKALVTRWTYGVVLWVIMILKESRICDANDPDYQGSFGGKFESQSQHIRKIGVFRRSSILEYIPASSIQICLGIDGNIFFIHVLASIASFWGDFVRFRFDVCKPNDGYRAVSAVFTSEYWWITLQKKEQNFLS